MGIIVKIEALFLSKKLTADFEEFQVLRGFLNYLFSA